MINNAVFVYSDQLLNYKFHEDHPFNQQRIKITIDLLKQLNLLKSSQIIIPRTATDEEIGLIHDSEYINAVRLAGKGKIEEENALLYGLGTEDTPIFADMHEISALVVGGTLKAVETIMEGKALHALNLGGGLHHGFSKKASGFCIYNDTAVAIKYIVEKYNKRVLYIDTDAHHGDGVQTAFYESNNVCTLSIHETGRYLFPGTGYTNERGKNKGFGYSFNIPIDAFTEDDSYLEVYRKSVNEIAKYFKPDIIVTQNGADSHFLDPLTHLMCTTNIYRYIPKLAHEIAHKYCNGRWLAVGGGGYDIWRVVPRTWSMIWLEMNDLRDKSRGELPKTWINNWQERAPVQLPRKWEDELNSYDSIPRNKEITEMNHITLNNALSILYL